MILHICGNPADRLVYLRESGSNVSTSTPECPRPGPTLAGEKLSLMGRTSDFSVVRNGATASISQDVQEKLRRRHRHHRPGMCRPLDAPWVDLRTL